MRSRRQADYTFTETLPQPFTSTEPIRLAPQPGPNDVVIDPKKSVTKTTTTKITSISAPIEQPERTKDNRAAYDPNAYKKVIVPPSRKVEKYTEEKPQPIPKQQKKELVERIPFQTRDIILKKRMDPYYGADPQKPEEAQWDQETMNKALTYHTSGELLPALEKTLISKGYLTVGGTNPNKLVINKRNVLSDSGLFGDRLREEIEDQNLNW